MERSELANTIANYASPELTRNEREHYLEQRSKLRALAQAMDLAARSLNRALDKNDLRLADDALRDMAGHGRVADGWTIAPVEKV